MRQRNGRNCSGRLELSIVERERHIARSTGVRIRLFREDGTVTNGSNGEGGGRDGSRRGGSNYGSSREGNRVGGGSGAEEMRAEAAERLEAASTTVDTYVTRYDVTEEGGSNSEGGGRDGGRRDGSNYGNSRVDNSVGGASGAEEMRAEAARRLEVGRATVATKVTRYGGTVEGERWEEEVLHSTTTGGVRYVYDLSGDARRTGQEGGDPQCTIRIEMHAQ